MSLIPAEEFRSITGRGVVGRVGGHQVAVGNEDIALLGFDLDTGDDGVLPDAPGHEGEAIGIQFPHRLRDTGLDGAPQGRQIVGDGAVQGKILNGKLDPRHSERKQQIPGKHCVKEASGQRLR